MVYKTLFILFIAVVSILPQNGSDNVTSEFQIGINLFQSHQNDEALNVFTRIAEQDFNPRTTASFLFEGKIFLLLSKEDDAIAAFSRLINDYPSSRYIDEAYMSLAGYYLEKSFYEKSLRQLCLLIQNTASPMYDSLARSLGESICLQHLSNNNLDTLLNTLTLPKQQSYLVWLKGKLRKHNQPDEIAGSLIGVVLPGTPPSIEILEGIKYAVSEYNNEHERKIGLLIRDSERKTEKIKTIKEEFDKINRIKAIIGPVYSDEVKSALEIFKDTNIPIISPTATENDLVSAYPDFYQANPSFIQRGRIMAQYIYFVENKKKMAILSPAEGNSTSVADAFKNEFIRLGGKIVVEAAYSGNSTDMGSQISKIQSKIKNIEGLYIPLTEKTDVSVILSQLEQQGINLTLYGNQEWLTAKGFESSSTLSNQLIFTSDYFIDYDDINYQQFNKAFHQKTGKDATRNVLYGYDAAEYVLVSFLGDDISRSALKLVLESGILIKGYHNNISFDSTRVNKFLNIIRYRDGKFQLVDKFKIGE